MQACQRGCVFTHGVETFGRDDGDPSGARDPCRPHGGTPWAARRRALASVEDFEFFRAVAIEARPRAHVIYTQILGMESRCPASAFVLQPTEMKQRNALAQAAALATRRSTHFAQNATTGTRKGPRGKPRLPCEASRIPGASPRASEQRLNTSEAFFVRSLSRQMNPAATTPADARAAFLRRFGSLTVGKLSVDKGVWTFRYSPAFRARNDMRPLPMFPDVNGVYRSDELWSFFRMRVPSLKQPAVRAIVDKEGIDSNDQITLLKRFGRRTISNPFELVEDEAPSGMTPALSR